MRQEAAPGDDADVSFITYERKSGAIAPKGVRGMNVRCKRQVTPL